MLTSAMGTWNGYDVSALVLDPRQCQLSGCAPVALRQLGHPVVQELVLGVVVGVETRVLLQNHRHTKKI